MNTQEIWDKALSIMENTASDVGYRVYIKSLEPYSHTDSVFTVYTERELMKNMVEMRCGTLIKRALLSVTGREYTLKIILKSELPQTSTPEDKIPSAAQTYPDTLNPRYTFDSFVVGESNRYAAAFARTTAERPGMDYNPFFLYGNSGLGKTHLIHAIGNEIRRRNPNYKIIYVTSEQFMNEFVESIISKTPMEFKRKYRSADVLLIDDVQFLESKEGLQEEIFHTFNDLYERNHQIVLTSDRAPAELTKLEDRLRNRFGQGLTFDISIPNFETRVAILKKKAEDQNIEMPVEVLHFIADKIKTNIRELEGALIKMVSMAEISSSPIDMELAAEVIDSLLPNGAASKITHDRIIEKVCVYYGISHDEICGKGRSRRISLPRQIAMYLCSTLANMNYSMIGDIFGGKDRTTAMHNVRKISNDLLTDENVKAAVKYISKDLEA